MIPRSGAFFKLARLAMVVADLFSLQAGYILVVAARYDGDLDRVRFAGLLAVTAAAAVAFLLASVALRLHQGRYAVGGADEFKALAAAVAVGGLVGFGLALVAGLPRLVPLSVPLIGSVLAFVVMTTYRLAIRSQREGAVRPRQGQPTLVFGAGNAGDQLIRSMLADPASPYVPVGLLDDDPVKRHVRIRGVRMLGGRDQIRAAAIATDAEVLVLALPSADSALVRDISQRATDAGLTVKVLPTLSDLLTSRIGIRDIRDIDIADLLGRHQIQTNIGEIAGYLKGKRVLVTGAGGSIGSELCRQIHGFGPAELMMLDRDESALHAVSLSIHGEAQLHLPEVILADIRDGDALRELFFRRMPDVVFHAAALKHVNMLEQYPGEGWKTNVLGTRNVLEAAVSVGVSHFINVSTDKAADPVNVLGRTKRMAERLTATYAQRSEGRFLSVRFGNVLGSRGSVLETFAAQIARGGPVTVTDPAVTRFFMTIPEAVELVIQAGAVGTGGEALVLDMGEPVRIADVAAQLIAMEGRPIQIRYTGLRPGEKLHEELFGREELDSRPVHPLISHVPVPSVEGDLEAWLQRPFPPLEDVLQVDAIETRLVQIAGQQ
ncbi:NDP-sugar epimerase, includes UDP-GlcNAc-inverting 4,6-dehydratase FlaA1 and capsular polysaccharide biosynthesis protein EpsC [Blastococcus aggregatus]|uniref:NDP-sugar epimerase, includes UDP-GlcNAc-inverting 4,6-dehydratase FlaA1 and capsular polysaccharide biosynthesis protein EpsC n=1 Tax=Blastococcus aggregatus TaxID=38502 RepID=A0A285V123_9ACTN|nr:nucleoside-diphosphate sugar epimerase/dehydratase [Blastococcus aggregatus]SOC47759.1 NDP-sugar epimerase, includes UDP-GlcNAc-inverting 4,6-dehydratase FlaA1 and capsular polysaccharide biosynthesis protein EpsC [Blastococcus aggregatus]